MGSAIIFHTRGPRANCSLAPCAKTELIVRHYEKRINSCVVFGTRIEPGFRVNNSIYIYTPPPDLGLYINKASRNLRAHALTSALHLLPRNVCVQCAHTHGELSIGHRGGAIPAAPVMFSGMSLEMEHFTHFATAPSTTKDCKYVTDEMHQENINLYIFTRSNPWQRIKYLTLICDS